MNLPEEESSLRFRVRGDGASSGASLLIPAASPVDSAGYEGELSSASLLSPQSSSSSSSALAARSIVAAALSLVRVHWLEFSPVTVSVENSPSPFPSASHVMAALSSVKV